MIETLQTIAKKLQRTKPLILIVALLFSGLFLATLSGVDGIGNDAYLIPSVLGVIWAALLFVLISVFPYVPAKPDKGLGFFARLKIRIKRGLYSIFGVFMIVLTIAVVLISSRMLVIWFTDF